MNEPAKDVKDSVKAYGGYGKRPMWQWIAIYLVVGVIVYGLIYYFVFYNQKSSSPYNTSNPAPQSKSLY
jgi:hypothetical protein